MHKQLTFFVMQCAVTVLCYTKPDKICDEEDTKCITESGRYFMSNAIHGMKEINTEPLDPMYLEGFEGELPNLKFSFKNITAKGFKDMIVNEITFMPPKYTFFDITFPLYEMTGIFEIKGIFLNEALDANVKFYVNATNTHMKMNTTKQIYKKNGEKYMRIGDVETRSEVLGTLDVHQESLSGELIPEHLLKLLNENPNIATEVFQIPIGNANMRRIYVNVNKELEVIPLKDLVLPNSYY